MPAQRAGEVGKVFMVVQDSTRGRGGSFIRADGPHNARAATPHNRGPARPSAGRAGKADWTLPGRPVYLSRGCASTGLVGRGPCTGMAGNVSLTVVEGDLLDQPVEAIVNAWNRNILPWWLLLPRGVSGAIKRRAGLEPFRELARKGPIPLGGCVVTGAGRLPHRAILHVAGIHLGWRSTEQSIRGSVRSALALAEKSGFASVAFPLIGAGTGGGDPGRVRAMMEEEILGSEFPGAVRLVLHRAAGV